MHLLLDDLKTLTERLDASGRQAKEIKERFQIVYKHSPIGICLVANDGYFIDVNPACERIWRRPKELLLRLRWQDITRPEYVESDEQRVDELLAGKIGFYSMFKVYFDENNKDIPAVLTVGGVFLGEKTPRYLLSQIEPLDDVERKWKLIQEANNATE